MSGYVLWRAFDRMSLKDKAADQLLRDAIATIDLERGRGVRSFPIRDPEAQTAMVAHVIPIRLSARDIFLRCAAVLAMTPVAAPQAPRVELVLPMVWIPRLLSVVPYFAVLVGLWKAHGVVAQTMALPAPGLRWS